MIDVKSYRFFVAIALFLLSAFDISAHTLTMHKADGTGADHYVLPPEGEDSCYIDTVYLKEKFSDAFYLGIYPVPDSVEWRYRVATEEDADSTVADSLWSYGAASDTCCVLIDSMEELSSYAAQVRIWCDSTSSYQPWSDILFDTTRCVAPSEENLTIQQQGTSVTMSWDVETTAWEWVLRKVGDPTAKHVVTDVGQITWRRLIPDAAYAWKVRVQCGDTWSDYSTEQFFNGADAETTDCQDPGDDDFGAKDISSSHATLFCHLHGTQYKWALRAHGSTGWSQHTTTFDHYKWKNLKPGTQYEYKVKINCGNNTWTNYSEPKYFTTTGDHYGHDCTTPYSHHMSAKDITHNSASTHCSIKGASYHWYLKEHGSYTDWIDYESHHSHYGWKNLKHNTKYAYKVKIKCSSGYWTGWSPTMYFTTTNHYGHECSTPYGHHMSSGNLTHNSASTFCDVKGASYHWYLKEYGSYSGWTDYETHSSHHSWKNLKHNTKYAYKVKVKCHDGHWTGWSPIKYFHTKDHYGGDCHTPKSHHFSVKDLSYSSATTHCQVKGGQQYHWFLREHGTQTWSDYNTSHAHHKWSHLKHNTKYEYKLKIKCSDSYWTGWSPTMYFTTHDHYGSECTTPYSHHMSVKHISYNSASTYCDINGSSYHWYLKEYGSYGDWTDYETNHNYHGWSNLKHNTKYAYKVKIKCSSGHWTGWSPIMYFTTHDHYGSTCSTPYSHHMSAKDIGYNSASTHCDMHGASYHWHLKEHGSYGGWTDYETHSSHHSWKNLKHNTKYAYKVKIKCHDGHWTGWSPTMYFTTHGHYSSTCSTPYSHHLHTKDITHHSASTHCDVQGASYHWYLKESKNTSPWQDYNTPSSHHGWTNLKPNTSYAYKVKVKCHSGHWTGWSPIKYFTTHDTHYGSGYCSTPQSHHLSAQHISHNSASTYCNISGASYHWYLRPYGSNAWIDYETSHDHHGWNNLHHHTKYEYKVKVKCHSGLWTSWSPIMHFTTHDHYGSHCSAPGYYDFAAYQSTYNLFKIHNYSAALKFTSAIRIAGGEWWQHTSSSHIIGWGNLEPNTMYEYRIKRQCTDGSMSDWSVIKTFWTGSAPMYGPSSSGDPVTIEVPEAVQEISTQSVEMLLYPSPASDFFSVAGLPAEAEIRIMDMQGQSLLSRTLNQSSSQVDIQGLENGLYQVLYIDPQGVRHTKKLIVIH